MIGNIIWYVTVFFCGVLFVGIGVYAAKLEKPMCFWAGTVVAPSSITDVKQYNAENARMWILYSLWYWAAGIAWIWSHTIALLALILGGTAGIAILIATYHSIEKKYKKTGL